MFAVTFEIYRFMSALWLTSVCCFKTLFNCEDAYLKDLLAGMLTIKLLVSFVFRWLWSVSALSACLPADRCQRVSAGQVSVRPSLSDHVSVTCPLCWQPRKNISVPPPPPYVRPHVTCPLSVDSRGSTSLSPCHLSPVPSVDSRGRTSLSPCPPVPLSPVSLSVASRGRTYRCSPRTSSSTSSCRTRATGCAPPSPSRTPGSSVAPPVPATRTSTAPSAATCWSGGRPALGRRRRRRRAGRRRADASVRRRSTPSTAIPRRRPPSLNSPPPARSAAGRRARTSLCSVRSAGSVLVLRTESAWSESSALCDRQPYDWQPCDWRLCDWQLCDWQLSSDVLRAGTLKTIPVTGDLDNEGERRFADWLAAIPMSTV